MVFEQLMISREVYLGKEFLCLEMCKNDREKCRVETTYSVASLLQSDKWDNEGTSILHAHSFLQHFTFSVKFFHSDLAPWRMNAPRF